MMGRYSTVLSLLVIVAGAFLLYQVKYKVQALQLEAEELTAQLAQERENLHVASAEWAYLNRPERLQALADKYLTLTPIAAAQIVDVPSIPMHESALAEMPAPEMAVQPVSLEGRRP